MKKNKKVKPRTQRLYFIIFSMFCLAGAAYFITSQLKDNMMFFLTPAQITERQMPANQKFRLGGLVKNNSFQKLEGSSYEFIVADASSEIKVSYTGLLPNLFREGQGVIATGKLNENGLFIATEILAKHDENYMPKEVYDELKKREEIEKSKFKEAK